MRRGSAHQCQIGFGSCGTCGLLFPGRGALRWHGERGNYCQDFSLGCEPMMIGLTVHPAICRPDFVSALAYAVLKVLIHERLSRWVAVWRLLHRRAYLRKGKSRGVAPTAYLERVAGAGAKAVAAATYAECFRLHFASTCRALNAVLRAARSGRPWPPISAPSRCSAEQGFSADTLFGISVCMTFSFGSHQGTRIRATSCFVLMIRNFNRSRPTFTTSDSRRRTCWCLCGCECGQSLRRAQTRNLSFRARRVCPPDSISSTPSRSAAARTRFRNRIGCGVVIALYPKAWRRRTGGPSGVC